MLITSVHNEHIKELVKLKEKKYRDESDCFLVETKHLVLEAVHPSPLSAYRGFIGWGHFSQANNYLLQQGLAPIAW